MTPPRSQAHSFADGGQNTFLRARSFLSRFIGILLLAFAAISSFGVERFPPPDFEPNYKMPVTTLPAPRPDLMEWVDVSVLLIALGLSTYFVLRKRSRNGILGLSIASLIYFGFYRKGCVCAIGSIQDVALALSNSGYAVPLAIVGFFLLPILFTLFFGRSFCAAVCPHGALQDLVLLKPVSLPPWLERPLRLLPFIYLGLAVLFAVTGSAFIICEWDPFIALFRRNGSSTMLALGAGFLLLGVFVGRPYCRFLCPYGAILSVISRCAKWNVKLSPDDCNQCALCDVACPYGAIAEPVHPEATLNQGKTRVVVAVLATLVLIGVGGWLGSKLSVPLSQTHRTVGLAERIAAEDAGKISETTDASKTFRQSGRSSEDLLKEALLIRNQFVLGGWILGGFVGFVLGAQLLALALRQPRTIYEPDRGDCVGCGRCYNFCPKEILRVKRLNKPAQASGESKITT